MPQCLARARGDDLYALAAANGASRAPGEAGLFLLSLSRRDRTLSTQGQRDTLIEIGIHCTVDSSTTSLPPHETDGCVHPFSHVGINVEKGKRVDMGVLRGAECNWLGEQKPISTV